MRFLADENFPGPAIKLLRARGHEVLWVKESMPGAPDRRVLEKAQAEERVLLTFDKDFGELAFRAGLPARSGVVLFRLSGTSPEADTSRVVQVIESREDWRDHFAVVTSERLRIRPMPRQPGVV